MISRFLPLITLDVNLISCGYQLFWHNIVLNGGMQSNHRDMLHGITLFVGEINDVKLVSK